MFLVTIDNLGAGCATPSQAGPQSGSICAATSICTSQSSQAGSSFSPGPWPELHTHQGSSGTPQPFNPCSRLFGQLVATPHHVLIGTARHKFVAVYLGYGVARDGVLHHKRHGKPARRRASRLKGGFRRGAPYCVASDLKCIKGSRPRCAHRWRYQRLPTSTWPTSSRRISAKISTARRSPARARRACMGGVASRPRASSSRGTKAMRASTSSAVRAVIIHRPSWASKSP